MSGSFHSYAVSIEHIVRKAFNCDRCGFGGIADADAIESKSGMYTAMACSLATIYNDSNQEHKIKIDNFLNEYSYYSDKSIKEIIEDCGEGKFSKLIEEFRNLLK